MQYGQYPQQQQPPQLKKKHTGCVISAVVAIVVVLAIIVIAASNSGNNASTANNTSQGNQNQQSSAPSTHGIGDAITINGWTVTLNSAKTTTTGTVLSQPKSGDVFLLLDVSLNNATGQSQNVSSLIQFALKDASGQGYNEALGSSDAKTPDGTLANGSKLRGTVVYEVPKSGSGYELDFTPALGSTDQAV